MSNVEMVSQLIQGTFPNYPQLIPQSFTSKVIVSTADFLKAAGQNYWQLLPLNHTTAQTRYSPYNCFSAFAGNPLLISPDLLYRDGLLTRSEVQAPPRFPADTADFKRAALRRLLDKTFGDSRA
jgi:4-alpha-glucanotransferase